jgi:hypothetical protein
MREQETAARKSLQRCHRPRLAYPRVLRQAQLNQQEGHSTKYRVVQLRRPQTAAKAAAKAAATTHRQ